MRSLRYAVPVLALALAAGCGSAGDTGASPTASPSAASPTTTSGPGAGPSSTTGPSATAQGPTSSPTAGPITPKPSLSTEPGARARPQSVLGTVSVKEGDCLLFTPGDMAESWVLVGSTEGLTPGKGYTLEGAMDDQLNPACLQGPTFIVSSWTPAS